MSQNKILITGALGFLGSNFVRINSYGKAKYDLTGIDRANDLSSLNNAYISPKFRFHIGDITDKHCLDRIFAFEKPDFVLHTASISEHDIANKTDAVGLLQNNIVGTQNIIDACDKYQIKRLIFISSDEIYCGPDKVERIAENANLNPNTLNGINKLTQELIIKAAHTISGLPYNIIRPCSLYGHRQRVNQLIPKVISCIMNKQNIFLNGSSGAIREWIYVSDVCDGITRLLEGNAVNQTWNITANHDISNIELIQKICNLMGGGHDLVKEEVLYKENGCAEVSMNAEKIKTIGWSHNVNLSEGLISTVDWYQRNKFFLKQ
jgi:dTDP-glucose 4,6-dehydratase